MTWLKCCWLCALLPSLWLKYIGLSLYKGWVFLWGVNGDMGYRRGNYWIRVVDQIALMFERLYGFWDLIESIIWVPSKNLKGLFLKRFYSLHTLKWPRIKLLSKWRCHLWCLSSSLCHVNVLMKNRSMSPSHCLRWNTARRLISGNTVPRLHFTLTRRRKSRVSERQLTCFGNTRD